MIDYGYIVKILGSLLLVVLMMCALLYLMKRFNFKGAMTQGSVRILSALNIGPRERIMLIQVGEEQILVGSTPSSIRSLHVLQNNIQTPSATDTTEPNMKTILASLMKVSGEKNAKNVGDEA